MRKSTSFASIPFLANTSSLGLAAPKGLDDDLRPDWVLLWVDADVDRGFNFHSQYFEWYRNISKRRRVFTWGYWFIWVINHSSFFVISWVIYHHFSLFFFFRLFPFFLSYFPDRMIWYKCWCIEWQCTIIINEFLWMDNDKPSWHVKKKTIQIQLKKNRHFCCIWKICMI